MCLLALFGLFNINTGREGGKEGGREGGQEGRRGGNKVVSESSCFADVRKERGRGMRRGVGGDR